MHTDQITLATPVQPNNRGGKLLKDIFYEETAGGYQQAIDKARDAVLGFLRDTEQPFSGIRPAVIREAVYSTDLNRPLADYDALLAEVHALYIRHATAFHLPQYIAHLNCPVVIPALAAEVIISAINSSQDTYDQSAGGTFIERRLIDWTANEIGYTNADGVFTAGGSQSNLMGLLLARDYFALQVLGHDVKRDGLSEQARRFRIFVSDKAHFSNEKNTWLLGLGEQAMVKVKTDSRFRMDVAALKSAVEEALAQGNIPIAIVATAGTTDFGNIDPLEPIADIASAYNLWMHVDAAYGCGLLLSDKYRHLLGGIERADSVTVDYHKSFFQPISSSAFLVKDKSTLQLVKHHADYLNPPEQDYDELPAQINKSITQSTRRFDALKLWCTLRLMGKQKLGIYTDMMIDTAAATAALLQQDPDFDLLSSSDLGVLVFRFRPAGIDTDLSALNLRIKQSLFFEGTYILASTKVEGEFYLKFTILNPVTTLSHIREILEAIKSTGYTAG
ncbi:pyridoxal phosphate-dependent decarboxylase family protein [Chitinophaga qingshengii]|uniref:Aspartate aminotransferase family protein n=1 Tax=Chitinophaga qingshengii TaxID=1569794 RepID=A0ABR7TFT0_9BACT|nr:aspartate aminotransferase family protein [Chitinophaga qingshengii]MBC9929222.1 aspartate aminotransferase family protein [Chitinophaga qingshengii]